MDASAFQMRTFMSSLPLNTYTPSPLKRTAKTLRSKAKREPRLAAPAPLSTRTHRCMRLVWYTSRLRPPLYAKMRTERS